ncbi:MAG: phage portal protein [Candidatus Micrarchaeia archaeon]|jgi:HK97 family phage portal protein
MGLISRGFDYIQRLSGFGDGGAGAGRDLVVRQADPATLTSPNFGAIEQMFFATPFTGWSHLLSGVTRPYAQHVWVYACVNAISQNIAGVPLSFYTGTKKDKRLVESGPLVKLFETPNPMMSTYQLIEATLIFLGITGESIYILDRENATQVPKEIWTFHPGRFQHVPGEGGLIRGWIYRGKTKPLPLLPHEVVHIKRFNPYDDYRGLSPLEVARLSLEQDYYAAKYNRNFFVNGAQPGGVLESKENLIQEEFDRLLAQWNDRHQGVDKAHEIALLEGGITYKQTGISQSDMLFLEGRKLNRDEILGGIYKVPKGELGIEDDTGSYAKDKVARKRFWETTLDPYMTLIEMGLWGQLCHTITGGVWPEFDRKSIPALQEDRDILLGQAQKLFAMGYPANVINEHLDMGLPEIDGGNVGYLPFNLQPAGSIQAPAPAAEPQKAQVLSVQDLPRKALPAPARRDAKSYWQKYNKLRTAIEEKFRGKIKSYFYDQRKLQLKLISDKLGDKGLVRETPMDPDDLLFNLTEANGKLRAKIWPLYLNAGQEAGSDIYAELGVDAGEFVIQDSAALEVLQDKLIKVVQINDLTREKLRETISEGLANTESAGQLQERVREVFNFTESRSLTIARTETGQCMAAARDAAMDKLKVENIEWGTAGDGEVRDTHAAQAGMQRKRGQTFPNGCRYPCDPEGTAGEVISCFVDHQIPIFTDSGWKSIGKIRPGDMVLTHQNRFRKVTRLSPQLSYMGEVIRLIPTGDREKSKRGITITPNHRFLMADGSWKHAHDIQPGNKIMVMAAFCKYCGAPIPYWLGYCNRSCLSKKITDGQWSSPAHRENISRKTSAQLNREYAAGVREPDEITKKAREVAFGKYGPGGFFAAVDRTPGSDFHKKVLRGIEQKWGSRLEMLKAGAFKAMGRASWKGSSLERSMARFLKKKGLPFKQQFCIGRRRIDFYCPEDKLFIECDSAAFHSDQQKDRRRDLEILTQYPDHQIAHVFYGNPGGPEWEYFNLLTLNHAGTYEQVAVEITEVKIWGLKKSRRLYNFAVEEDESYIAKGFVSHNCRCVGIPVVGE